LKTAAARSQAGRKGWLEPNRDSSVRGLPHNDNVVRYVRLHVYGRDHCQAADVIVSRAAAKILLRLSPWRDALAAALPGNDHVVTL